MTEKVAVLTDIHGNAPALRAVLDEVQRAGTIARVICLGDAISIGPDTNEVLDLLCSLPNLTMVTGNHEQYVLALAAGKALPFTGEELAHQQWIAARTDRRFIPFLAGLPWSTTLTVGDHRLLLQHYHLDPIKGFASVDKEPSLAKLEQRYADADADVICFGHHHPVHLFRSEQRVFLNPGSLGCADRPVARYAVLQLSQPDVGVELRAVPYDNRPFLASYDRLEVPARDFIRQAFHGNQHKPGR